MSLDPPDVVPRHHSNTRGGSRWRNAASSAGAYRSSGLWRSGKPRPACPCGRLMRNTNPCRACAPVPSRLAPAAKPTHSRWPAARGKSFQQRRADIPTHMARPGRHRAAQSSRRNRALPDRCTAPRPEHDPRRNAKGMPPFDSKLLPSHSCFVERSPQRSQECSRHRKNDA